MDPDAALEAIQSILAYGESNPIPVHMYQELEDHVRGLDKWLCTGGFLPAAWAANR